jgi:hypothetical protein
LEKCCADFTSLREVQFAQLRDGNEKLIFQVPLIRSFRVSIPEVVIPEGRSLLAAFPGVKVDDMETFMLITPRAEPGMNQDQDEWD